MRKLKVFNDGDKLKRLNRDCLGLGIDVISLVKNKETIITLEANKYR
jgi:hypothetical protein